MTDPLLPESARLRYAPAHRARPADLVRYRDNPDFLRFYPGDRYTERDAAELLAQFSDWAADRPVTRRAFTVSLPDSPLIVGICSIRMPTAVVTTAEIGFELDPKLWGHGFASEMATALLKLGFETLQLHRIEAHCMGGNTRSAAVLERIGMRQEGQLREKHRVGDHFHDELWFGILRDEWDERTGSTDATAGDHDG